MQLLGLSLICTGPPVAFGFALRALHRASPRWMAFLAVVLSGLELIAWLLVLANQVIGILSERPGDLL